MSCPDELNNNEPEFCWGKKRGIGRVNKDTQFYESFTFDGVNYSLYDCVYLFKMGDLEPYIGKIVGIWEKADGNKNVKILWFFHPNEIQNYLGDHVPLEKEIFLASGGGVGDGASNINPLEAIAGKCCVICTSKDERNPQPSKEALKMADYIFYRTFDVRNYTISEKIADKIAEVEVKLLLNRDEDVKPTSVSQLELVLDEKAKTFANAVSSNLSKSDSPRSLEKGMKDGKFGHIPSLISKNVVKERKHLDEGKELSDEKNALKLKHDSVNAVGKESKAVTSHADVSSKSSKRKAFPSVSNDKPSKMMKLSDDSVRLSDDLRSKNATGTRKLKLDSDEDDSGKDSVRLQSSEKVNISEKKILPAVSMENNAKTDNKIVEVTKNPDAERSRWFKKLAWEPRIKQHDGLGTLVFLDNLDPSYTSGEIEDIIYHSLKQSCSAKAIQQGTFQYPHYGQAYIIFRTAEAADEAVQKINTGCLMLPGGRPLTASRGMLKLPAMPPAFTGHLTIDKLKFQQHGDWRKAVATSHCSQPNTIEYDMAMEWLLVQEKSVYCFDRLHKAHGDQRSQLQKNLKAK